MKKSSRKIYIFTTVNSPSKEIFFKRKGIKIIKIFNNNNKTFNLKKIFITIKKLGLSRILVESGSTFLSQLLRNNLIKNLYLFKSSKNLLSKGQNNSSILQIKKIKILKKDKVEVNLYRDNLYKVNL